MTYEVVFLNIFLKQFKKITPKDTSRIRDRIKELSGNPYLGVRLRGELGAFWKDRIGDYRIIYKIEEDSKRIVLYDVGLRKNIYE